MTPQFKALFTEYPSHEAITELLDCLQVMDVGCHPQPPPRPTHHDHAQPDLCDFTPAQAPPLDP